MPQTKITLEPSQSEFLKHHQVYGFKDKSALVREALRQFQERLLHQELVASAELYTELYEQDEVTRELTEAALTDWPE